MNEQSPPNDEGTPSGSARPAVTPGPAMPPPPPPGYYPPPPPQKPRGGVLARIVASVVTSVLVLSILVNIYLGGMLVSMTSGPSEATYQPGNADHRIVILPIRGLIDDDAYEFVRRSLQQLRQEPPKALVLRVDSGGGFVAPSDQIWHELERFKKETAIPIVASFGSIAASGGYYVAMAADHLLAEPTTVTGSIGVMAQAFTIDQLLGKVGVTPEVLVATDSPEKDTANDIMRPWTERDRQQVRTLLDHAHRQFVVAVTTGRSGALSEEEIREVAKGQIFTAHEAEAARVVDGIGYLEDAIAEAASRANVPAGVDPRVTVIRQPRGFGMLGLLGSRSSGSIAELSPGKLRAWLIEQTLPRLMYLCPIVN